jgi:hypothetical protein
MGVDMNRNDTDEDELEECPNCRSDMVPQRLWTKSNEEFGISCSRYRLWCPECEHVDKEYEVMD